MSLLYYQCQHCAAVHRVLVDDVEKLDGTKEKCIRCGKKTIVVIQELKKQYGGKKK